jgi:hypothetical protein
VPFLSRGNYRREKSSREHYSEKDIRNINFVNKFFCLKEAYIETYRQYSFKGCLKTITKPNIVAL